MIFSVKKDKSCLLAKCRMYNHEDIDQRCQWSLRAMVKASTENITITKANLIHSNETADHYFRGMHTSLDCLADHIMEIIIKNRATYASMIRDKTQALVHHNIQYHTTYTAKIKCVTRLDGFNKDSFYLIPDHCEHILERDPGATTKWSAPNAKFEMLFICPSTSRHTFEHNMSFIAFDGTHTKCTYPQIFLLATTLDAKNTIVILAYVMVPSGNGIEWRRFRSLLHEAILEIVGLESVFISDWEKGLLPTMRHVLPTIVHCHCTWHLGDIRTEFGKNMSNASKAWCTPQLLISLNDARRGSLRSTRSWAITFGHSSA